LALNLKHFASFKSSIQSLILFEILEHPSDKSLIFGKFYRITNLKFMFQLIRDCNDRTVKTIKIEKFRYLLTTLHVKGLSQSDLRVCVATTNQNRGKSRFKKKLFPV
jgi:sulfatase maturation enzyme AslB (radical SAM superfamily)